MIWLQREPKNLDSHYGFCSAVIELGATFAAAFNLEDLRLNVLKVPGEIMKEHRYFELRFEVRGTAGPGGMRQNIARETRPAICE